MVRSSRPSELGGPRDGDTLGYFKVERVVFGLKSLSDP
jgi:hypothetical protein